MGFNKLCTKQGLFRNVSFKVDVGKIYEIVVTTWDGLYRYRTEDLVEVIGFYGTIPKYQFVRRSVYYSTELP